jgi:hypothetical protein
MHYDFIAIPDADVVIGTQSRTTVGTQSGTTVPGE